MLRWHYHDRWLSVVWLLRVHGLGLSMCPGLAQEVLGSRSWNLGERRLVLCIKLACVVVATITSWVQIEPRLDNPWSSAQFRTEILDTLHELAQEATDVDIYGGVGGLPPDCV